MSFTLAALAAAAVVASAPVAPGDGVAPVAPIVFFDIAGPDMARLRAFYSQTFGWAIDGSGSIKGAAPGGLDGTLRQDPAQVILYLGVPDVTAALANVTAHGGWVVQPRFEVPGVVVLGLCADPAGNPLGLIEMKDGKPVIPPRR